MNARSLLAALLSLSVPIAFATEPQPTVDCCDRLPPVRRDGPGAAALDTIRDWLRRERWTTLFASSAAPAGPSSVDSFSAL